MKLPTAFGGAGVLRLVALIAISMIALIPRAAAQRIAAEPIPTTFDESAGGYAVVVELAPEDLPLQPDEVLLAAEAQNWTAMAVAVCTLAAWGLRRYTDPRGWLHTRAGMLVVTGISAALTAIAHALSMPHPTVATVAAAGLVAAVFALVAATNPTTLSTRARAATDSGLALLAAVLLLLSPSLARADEPPPLLLPLRAPLVLPMPSAPDPTPIPAQDLAAKLGVVRGQIDALALQLGAPLPKTLPPQFWDTTPGKVVAWTLFGLGLAATGAQTGIAIWQAVR